MKFGVMYNTAANGTDPDALLAFARHAEDCGFESFYTPEHVALYPGASVGPVSFPPDLPVADPLECLSFVAAVTERILLGTGVLLLPYHQPVVLASGGHHRPAVQGPDAAVQHRRGRPAGGGGRRRRRLRHPRSPRR